MNQEELTEHKIKSLSDDIIKDRNILYQSIKFESDNKKLEYMKMNKLSLLDSLSRLVIKLQKINKEIQDQKEK
jgi:hypothetical protein